MSRLPRLFLPMLTPELQEILLEAAPARYLVKVLRKKQGDPFLGIDPQGRQYDLCLKGDDLRNPTAGVLGVREGEPGGNCSITLAQGLPKGPKMDSILRQCTEVGVDRFIPLLTKRCVSRPEEGRRSGKIERWGKILVEACQQSGRDSVPRLDPVTDWATGLGLFPEFDLVLMPYENQAPPLWSLLVDRPDPKNLLVLIGPEGGWAPEEVLEAEEKGAFPIHLPTPILRTETAGVATTAILRSFLDPQGPRNKGKA